MSQSLFDFLRAIQKQEKKYIKINSFWREERREVKQIVVI